MVHNTIINVPVNVILSLGGKADFVFLVLLVLIAVIRLLKR